MTFAEIFIDRICLKRSDSNTEISYLRFKPLAVFRNPHKPFVRACVAVLLDAHFTDIHVEATLSDSLWST